MVDVLNVVVTLLYTSIFFESLYWTLDRTSYRASASAQVQTPPPSSMASGGMMMEEVPGSGEIVLNNVTSTVEGLPGWVPPTLLLYCAVAVWSYVNYVVAWQRDPGYVEKGWNDEDVENLKHLDFVRGDDSSEDEYVAEGREDIRFCSKCQDFKPQRAHHCSICGKCVLRMDHHCPWINNCVGLRNHRPFVVFIAFATLSLTISELLLARVVFLSGHLTDGVFVRSPREVTSPRVHRSYMVGGGPTVSFLMLVIVFVFCSITLIALIALFVFQVTMVVKNMTTIESLTDNEKYNKGARRNIKVSGDTGLL
mmetsp:Transcript_15722/g.39983  ORF Transcript_15722/g.39983 Transcript_15722/m.39983 type:complete len:310 (-) Transcript_15722:2059-2988(-)